MNFSRLSHQSGRVWGRWALRPVLRFYDRRCATFTLTVHGVEHLRTTSRRPCLLVANHVLLRPEDMLLAQMPSLPFRSLTRSHRFFLFNCPADSFILRRIVWEETARRLRVVSMSNWGVWSSRAAKRLFQAQVIHPFGNGLREGLGYVPLEFTGRSLRGFLQGVEGAVGRGDPVLMFPGKLVPGESGYLRDGLLDGTIQPGAAHVARRYGVPILPVYISGAEGWQPGQAATVTFGPAFGCDGMGKEDICREIIMRVRTLGAEPCASGTMPGRS